MELEQLWKRTENHLYWSLHLPRSANPQIRLTVKTFIFRFFITNTFSSYALLIWEVSTIKHKFLNNSVERVSFEIGRLPSGRSTAPLFTQWMKISCSSRAICENKSKMILPTHPPPTSWCPCQRRPVDSWDRKAWLAGTGVTSWIHTLANRKRAPWKQGGLQNLFSIKEKISEGMEDTKHQGIKVF